MLKKTIFRSAVFFLIICLFFIIVQKLTVFDLQGNSVENTILNTKSNQYRIYSEIPTNLRVGIVTIEDKRFGSHFGIDPIALIRSTYQTIRYNRVQGGSTIEQQLIKITEQQYKRTILRKFYERRWAVNLQFHYSKETILLSYINSIPFSHGITGWRAACDVYLHKSCELLSDAEFSYLLALSQLGMNPYKKDNQIIISSRATTICKKLIPNGITSDAGCNIIHETLQLEHYEPRIDPKVISFLSSETSKQQQAFQVDIYKSINGILQTTKQLRDQYNVKDCCVVILNSSGDLVSMNMCSSRDDEAGRINLCLKPRQTGSAVKPFLYIYALRTLGLTPKDSIVDEPIAYDLGDGSMYEPKNFDLSYHGKVSLAYALGNSLNIPAIKLVEKVGVDNFLSFLQHYIQYFAPGSVLNTKTSSNVGLSLALGTYEISPYEFTQLWRMLLISQTPDNYKKQSQEVVDVLSNPLYKVSSFGQDSFLNTRGWAVKTGTSRKFIDGRVCGVNNAKGLTICIWMGNYNNEAMKGPSGEVGSYVWKLITDNV